tara:strand:+ start:4945 stop:5169 length:225 start_codon:yes stop_codon:yes gene_type:complete
MDSVVLDRAILATGNAVKAMVKEIAAGPGKARFHAETFVHSVNALRELEVIKEEVEAKAKKELTRAPTKKAAVK